mgnify:CR=1 FL=1|jgi:hypothetical protein
MKYIIILYLCSFANVEPTCYSEKVMSLEFNNYYDCILEGYKQSHSHLASLDKEQITKQKLAIRFQCKEIKTENI